MATFPEGSKTRVSALATSGAQGVPRGRLRRGLLASMAALAAVTLAAAPAAAVAPGWSHPTLVFAERFGPGHSMVLDAAGKVHIAAEGPLTGGIWYITNAGGSWTMTQVTHKVDQQPSIALDGGHVYIAFDRRDPNTLKSKGLWTATNASGSWVAIKRHTGRDLDPSLRVRGGRYHLAFWTNGGGLRYLSNAAGGWSLHTIDTTCCSTGGPSLRLNDAGRVRIAYADGSPASPTGLRYAKQNAGGTWSVQTVDFHASEFPALALFTNGSPDIAYVRRGVGTYEASPTPSGWQHFQVGHGYLDPPDLAVWGSGPFGSSEAIVMGDDQKVTVVLASGDQVDTFDLVSNAFNPEVEQHSGRLRVIFNRATGGTGDGIYYTKEN